MKILQIGNYSLFDKERGGGTERLTYSLSEQLSSKGHYVTLIGATKNKARMIQINKRFKIILLKGLEFLNAPINFSYIKYISKNDIIHLHFPSPTNAFIGGFFAKLLRKPYIITYHSPILSYHLIKHFYNFVFLKYLLRNSKYITIPSPNCYNHFPILPFFKYKVKVIPNGVDASRFFFRQDAKKYLSNYIEFNNSFIVAFVSVLDKVHHQIKGLPILLSALKTLIDREERHDIKLVIVGAGNYKVKYEELTKKMGLNEKVTFLGGLPNQVLPYIYSASNCFVLPSTQIESFGIVLAEAMACQCPVIGSNVGGIPFVIGNAGLLVEPNNPTDLVEKILLLINNNEKRHDLIKKGLNRVNSKFSIKNTVDQYEKLYFNVIGEKN